MTYLVTYHKYHGQEQCDELVFMDEYRTEAQKDAAGRYWFNEWRYWELTCEDLFPDESALDRVRRQRDRRWETWR